MTSTRVRENISSDLTIVDLPTALQKPDRRWRLISRYVQEWTDSGTGIQPSIRDPLVERAFHAELARRKHDAKVSRSRKIKSDILAAIQVGQTASNQADLIRAFLLARQSPAEVATTLGLQLGVVLWFTRLFFEVTNRLDACDWISVHVLHAAERLMDETEYGCTEYVIARDRCVLFHTAYTGGIDILKRIIRPAELQSGSSARLLNGSPLCRFLTWLWTVEASFPVCVQVLERIQLLLGNEAIDDNELDHRLEILADYVEHCGQTRSARKVAVPNESDMSDSPKDAIKEREATEQITVDETTPTAPDSPCSESTAA